MYNHSKHLVIASAFILIIVLAISIAIVAYYYQPIVLEGVVDHMALVGVKEGNYRTILIITPYEILVKDDTLKTQIKNLDNLSIYDIKEIVDSRYEEVYCTVSIKLLVRDPLNNLKPGDTMAYIAGVEYLGKLGIGYKIRFEITRLDPLRIYKILDISPP